MAIPGAASIALGWREIDAIVVRITAPASDGGSAITSYAARVRTEAEVGDGNADAKGMAVNATNAYVVDDTSDKVFVYRLSDGARQESQEFGLDAANGDPLGIAVSAIYAYVADDVDEHVYVYRLSDGARQTSQEFGIHSTNTYPVGIAVNATYAYVADRTGSRVFVYQISDGTRQTSQEFNFAAANGRPAGIAVNATYAYVVDQEDEHVYVYRLADGGRETGQEFDLDAANADAQGIAVNVTGAYTVDEAGTKVFAYQLPGGARQTGKEFDLYSPLPAGPWVETAGILLAAISQYVVANLQANQAYEFQALATNADGNGPWSATLDAATLEVDNVGILNQDLTKVQIGLEGASAPGTLVAATRLVPYMDGSYEPEITRKSLDEIRGVRADIDDVVTRRMSTLELTQELDFENILAAFLCGFASVTPSGSDPYTWGFTPGTSAPVALRTATIEIAETDGASAHYRRRFGFARPTTIGIEAGDDTGQISTTWEGRAAQALTAPTSVPELGRTIIPAALFQVYIDDTWAKLGDTAFGQLRSLSAEYIPGLQMAYNEQGRADLDATHWRRMRMRGTLSLTVDHDGDTSAELAHWEGGDLRFVRIEAVSGTKRLTLDHCMRYLDTPDVLAADEKQHTLELNGELRADTTSARNQFRAAVVNGVSSW